MSKYILICPICGSSNLEYIDNVFECIDCDEENRLEDMDFESDD